VFHESADDLTCHCAAQHIAIPLINWMDNCDVIIRKDVRYRSGVITVEPKVLTEEMNTEYTEKSERTDVKERAEICRKWRYGENKCR
jgi:PhoPQ-activated pathogenicity-related protein